MVCNRCVKVVKNELERLGLHPESVQMGEVNLRETADQIDRHQVNQALSQHGFELLDDKKALQIEKIKNIIVELIHHRPQSGGHLNFSHLIEEKLHLDYTYLSALFSSSEGTTIEKYIIRQRIERAKELLVYDELNLSEIALELGYSSVQHLSNQFKKVTGLTPSQFKKLKENQRRPLDEI